MVPLKSIIRDCIISAILTCFVTIINVRIIEMEENSLIFLTSFIIFVLFFVFNSSLHDLLKNGSSIQIVFEVLISIDSVFLIESFDAATVFALKGQHSIAAILFVMFIFSFVNIFVLYKWAEK